MRRIKAYGKEIHVERWVNYVAADKDGDVFGYSIPPILKGKKPVAWSSANDDYVKVDFVNTSQVDWKQSVVQYVF